MATGQQLPAPRPWRIEGQAIRDREGGVVVSALNPASMATRRLIVEAVNRAKNPRNCDAHWTLAEAVLASGEAKAEAPSLTGMGALQLVRFCKWLFAPAEKQKVAAKAKEAKA